VASVVVISCHLLTILVESFSWLIHLRSPCVELCRNPYMPIRTDDCLRARMWCKLHGVWWWQSCIVIAIFKAIAIAGSTENEADIFWWCIGWILRRRNGCICCHWRFGDLPCIALQREERHRKRCFDDFKSCNIRVQLRVMWRVLHTNRNRNVS